MPPKKKGAKKKVGKAKGSSKGPTLIDGVPVSEMTKEQLEGHVRRLQEEVLISYKLSPLCANLLTYPLHGSSMPTSVHSKNKATLIIIIKVF